MIFKFFLLFLFVACAHNSVLENFSDMVIISSTPINFTAVNTIYDDYNSSTLPYPITESVSKYFKLLFSSNRYGTYDIVSYDCMTYFNKSTLQFVISAQVDLTNKTINTKFNEFGPQFSNTEDNKFYYTSDSLGTLDLFSADYNSKKIKVDYDTEYDSIYFDQSTIEKLAISTDSTDEAYLTSTNISGAVNYIFCSNRDDSVFNIFTTESLEEPNLTKESILSNSKDDKCPYISDSLLIFTSNRDGGFGGYDLYYSRFINGEWGTPINFGDKINSKYDEFRPIIIKTNSDDFFNNMMIFSSNRPGGLGGFDLYYVGIERNLK